MKKLLGSLLTVCTAFSFVLVSGCAGPSGPPVSVVITNPVSSPTIARGQSVGIAAAVSNSPSNSAVTWSLSGSSCATNCGSLSNQSAIQVTYNAPATVPASFVVTITATSVADPSKSASLMVTVAAISVSITRKVNQLAALPSPWPTASVLVSFVASVQNDPSGGGVTWTLTAGGAPCSPACGSLLTNLPGNDALYTPPSSVPAAPSSQPTITATSITDSTKSDSDTFTLFDGATACATAGSESELNGQYAILLQGWADGSDGSTPTVYAASFTADGTGKIIGGFEQLNLPIVAGGGDILTTASSYSVGPDGRGCLTLTDQSDDTQTLRFSLGGISGGVASKGDVLLFSQNPATDYNQTLTLRASGILRKQDPSAFSLSALAPSYTLGLSGWDDSSGTLQRYALAGSITQSNGVISSEQLSVNDGGKLSAATFGNIDSTYISFGDFVANLSLPGNAFSPDVEILIINSSELFVVSSQPTGGEVTFAGRAIAAPSSFGASSPGPAYIFHSTGNTSSGTVASVGLINFSGGISGTVSGTLAQYSPGDFGTSAISGNYAVTQPFGLVTISPASPAGAQPSEYVYLATPYDGIGGFGITTDSSAALAVFSVQPYGYTGAPSILTPSGNFILGSGEPGDNTALNISGIASASGNPPSLSATEDVASASGLTLGVPFAATISINPDGTANLGPNTLAVTNGTELFFLEEGSGATNLPPEVQILEQ